MARQWKLVGELRRRNVIRAAAAYLVVAWLLVQIGDILLGAFDAPDWILRAVIIILTTGFPVVLVLSWAFEFSFQGIKREAESDEQAQLQRIDRRQMDSVIIGVLLVAVVLFAAERFNWVEFGSETSSEPTSLAVLPFIFLGPNADDGYFADAMTDELIGRLGKIHDVRIKSRQSVAQFKTSKQSTAEIAAQLDVNFILEGSVRKSGNRVNVTVQLTDTSSGFDEWSDVFDGEAEDWFKLHEEMAIKITRALDLHLSPGEVSVVRAHFTDNRDAYDAFWRGWLLLESFHADFTHPEEKVRAAEKHLHTALELDPSYPLAIAGLSLTNSYYYFYGVDRSAERLQRAMELARDALDIDPDFAEGRVALGMAFSTLNDHTAAVSEFRKALAADSENGVTWCLLAYSCVLQDPPNLAGAEEAARTAIRHDPTWTYSYHVLGWSLFLQGRYEESAVAYQRGVEFNPDYYDAQFGLGNAHLELGNFAQAMVAYEAAYALKNSSQLLVHIAASQVGLGDFHNALANLKLGLEQGFDSVDAIEGSPFFAPLREDPRFAELLESYTSQ